MPINIEAIRVTRASAIAAEAPRPAVVPETRKRPNYADNIAKSRGTYSHCPETLSIRRRVERTAKKRIGELVHAYARDRELAMSIGISAHTLTRPTAEVHWRISQALRLKYQEQGRLSTRSPYDFKAELAVSRATTSSGSFWLMRCFEGDGLHGIFDFLRRSRVWTDYHYQNAGDRPDHITARAWAGRARVWESMVRSDGTPDHQMVVEIITPEWWGRVNPCRSPI